MNFKTHPFASPLKISILLEGRGEVRRGGEGRAGDGRAGEGKGDVKC